VSDATYWTLDSLPIGVWVGAVPNGEVVYTNRAFRQIVGMEAVSASRIEDVPVTYHVRDRQGRHFPVDKLPFARAAAELRPVVVDDMVLHRSDGVQVYLRAFGLPKLDATGAATEVVVAFVDITREATALAERDVVNARLDLVVRHTPLVIWAAGLDGTMTLCEGAGLASIGLQPGELVGHNVFERYAAHPTLTAYIRRAMAGESFHYTVVVDRVTFDTWITPLRDPTGKQIGVAAVSHDVTEIRQLQAHAIHHDHQAAMGLLAASVAHEINNPITYVLASATTVQHEVERLDGLLATASPEVRASIARLRKELAPIHDGASRIATITRDLHTFVRPDDERLPVRIGDVLRSAFQLIGREIEARARLTITLDGDATVRANHARLLQVFLNLLTNALQALPEVGEHEIGVRSRIDGARVLIELADTGPGVPPELRERIFEPFVTTKEVGEGTGLGLFVCRNIVRSLGGTIELDSPPGGGAVFRVSLPIDHTIAPSAPAVAVPAIAARILVIDDDPIVLRALAGQLGENPSYQVIAIDDPARALELCQREAFDLIYCDLMMRGTTGMAIERALREHRSGNADHLVFMTGGAFTPEAQAFVRANATRVVDKPFDIAVETARRLQADAIRYGR
jgi:PAS domain S-box-containing protein